MFKIKSIQISAEASEAIRNSVAGHLGRLAETSLATSVELGVVADTSKPETELLVDGVLEDLLVLTEVFTSPILNQIAMK